MRMRVIPGRLSLHFSGYKSVNVSLTPSVFGSSHLAKLPPVVSWTGSLTPRFHAKYQNNSLLAWCIL
jgi:hypothetical protein